MDHKLPSPCSAHLAIPRLKCKPHIEEAFVHTYIHTYIPTYIHSGNPYSVALIINTPLPSFPPPPRASRAKLQRLEKETQEMEKTMEALRHTQAKCSELEKGNKKLMEQTHADRKEITKLKEELHGSKAKVQRSK